AWSVGEAYGAVGGVDALPAGAAGAEHLHPHLARVDRQLPPRLNFGRHAHGREGGVLAGLGVVGADARQAVHAVLSAEPGGGVGAVDPDGDLVHPTRAASGMLLHAQELRRKAELGAEVMVGPR